MLASHMFHVCLDEEHIRHKVWCSCPVVALSVMLSSEHHLKLAPGPLKRPSSKGTYNLQRLRCPASVTAASSVGEADTQGLTPFQTFDIHAMFSCCLTFTCCRRRSGSRKTQSWRSSSMRCVLPQRQRRSLKAMRPLLLDAFPCTRCSGATVGGGWFSSHISPVRDAAHGERQMSPFRAAHHLTMWARPVPWRELRALNALSKNCTLRQVLEPRPSSDMEHSINQEYPSRLLSNQAYTPPVLNDNHLSRLSPATYRTGSAPSARSTISRRRHHSHPPPYVY